MITPLDTKNSRQPVLFWEGEEEKKEKEEREEGKQSDTSSQLSGRSVRVEEILQEEEKK